MRGFIFLSLLLLVGCGKQEYNLGRLQHDIKRCHQQKLERMSPLCKKTSIAEKIVQEAIVTLQSNPKRLGDDILTKQMEYSKLSKELLTLEKTKPQDKVLMKKKRNVLREKRKVLNWYLAVIAYFESPA